MALLPMGVPVGVLFKPHLPFYSPINFDVGHFPFFVKPCVTTALPSKKK